MKKPLWILLLLVLLLPVGCHAKEPAATNAASSQLN